MLALVSREAGQVAHQVLPGLGRGRTVHPRRRSTWRSVLLFQILGCCARLLAPSQSIRCEAMGDPTARRRASLRAEARIRWIASFRTLRAESKWIVCKQPPRARCARGHDTATDATHVRPFAGTSSRWPEARSWSARKKCRRSAGASIGKPRRSANRAPSNASMMSAAVSVPRGDRRTRSYCTRYHSRSGSKCWIFRSCREQRCAHLLHLVVGHRFHLARQPGSDLRQTCARDWLVPRRTPGSSRRSVSRTNRVWS